MTSRGNQQGSLTFRQLLVGLEAHVGRHHLPMNRTAVRLGEVFDAGPLDPTLMTRIVRGIYKANRCQRLDDPIRAEPTLAELARQRFEVLSAPRTDLPTRDFMDTLVRAARGILETGEPDRPPANLSGDRVVTLPVVRRRRRG